MRLLAIPTGPLVRIPAIAIRSIGGIEIGTPVTVVFAKAGEQGTLGKLYSDEGGTYRWITVHPHGEDEKGTPVKIRESKTEPGTWHVVGGAGGHLNYLRITGVKTPEEYRQKSQEKRHKRESLKREKAEAEKRRKAGLTEEERGAETAASEERATKRAAAKKKHREEEQEFIQRVAKSQGWPEKDWQFDDSRLKAAGTSERRILQLEADHHKRMLARARAVLNQSKNVLIAKGAEKLHGAPLHTDDPDKIGLDEILDGPEKPTGKGFASPTKKLSDLDVREEVMQRDRKKLEREAKALQTELDRQGDDGSHEATTRAALAEVQGQLRMQSLIEEAARTTPEDRAKERKQLDTALAAATKTIAAEHAKPAIQAIVAKLGKGDTLDAGEAAQAKALTAATADAERLRARQDDLDVMEKGSAAPAIRPEAKALSVQKREARAAEIEATQGPEAAERYRERIETMQRRLQQYRADVKMYHETGMLPKKPSTLVTKAVSDPEEVLGLLAADKALKRRERAIAEAAAEDKEIDERLYGKPAFTETGEVDPATLKAVKQEIDKAVETSLTQSFLEKAESPELLLGHGGQFREDYDEHTLHRALERHLGAGTYNVLNNAALATLHDSSLSREAVDVLGPKPAAQLLASALIAREGKAVASKLADKLGEYHVQQNVLQAGERLREIEEDLNDADQARKQVTNPNEIAAAMAANRERAAKLEAARATAGQALGEYEATAALVEALGHKPADELYVNLGPVGTESAIRQLRAIGLDQPDYQITSDGVNHFATIAKSGFGKLMATPDPARAKLTEEVLAIKRGERDDPKWMPKGAAKRASTTFRAEGLQPAPLRAGAPAFNTMKNGAQLEEHIARRIGDGEDVNDILPDVISHMSEVPAQHRAGVQAALDNLFPTRVPTTKDGKPVYVHDPKTGEAKLDEGGKPIQATHAPKAEDFRAAAEQLTERYMAKQGHGDFAPIRAQHLDLDSDEGQEALVRAITPDPRTMVAFHPLGDLTSQDQRALRSYFASEIAKPGTARAMLDANLKALGPEPTREVKGGGLFGGTATNPEWLTWKQRHDKILEDHHFHPGGGGTKSSAWDEYVSTLGGVRNAYEAIQDHMKSGFLQRFHTAYTTLTGKPLRLGTRHIAHAELHTGYRDPAMRDRLLAQRRQLLTALRARTRGKFAAGSVADKMKRHQQQEEVLRQNQSSMLLPGGPESAKKMAEHERYYLGETAENQLRAIMPNVASRYRPLGGKIDLVKDRSFAGPFIHQQRAIKAFLASHRMAAALGTGCIAGDTLMVDARRGPLRAYDLWLSGASFMACAWSGVSLAPMLVSHVYCKGYEQMFTVTVDGGPSITVTADHRFLTAEGWLPLHALNVRDRIGVMPPDNTAPTPVTTVDPSVLREFDKAAAAMLPHLDRRLLAQPTNSVEAPPATWRALPPLIPIIGIDAVGQRLVFDCTVPIHANYAANGIINHNSGKTAIMMNAQTEGRARGVMKRGLYLVPAGVVEQFAPEFARFVDPKAMTWAANPGASHSQRLAELADAKTDAVVHSHQAFREDTIGMLAEDWGVSEKDATKRFMDLDRTAAKEALAAAWKKRGINFDAMFVDEGHGFLDRAGKPDSVLSRIAQAASDSTPYYMSSSADPIKNDVSELRSLMTKLVPGQYEDKGAWQRRYGVDTTASAEALKREVAPYIYAGNIKVENKVNRRREVVPLTPTQQASYDAVNAAYEKVRAARLSGTADVASAKLLAPERFKGVSAGEQEAVAKSVARNAGTLREARLQDVVDASEPDDNAKIQKLVAIAKEEDRTKKPLVVFAHRIDAVKKIAATLKKAGLSVGTYVGADGQKERAKKRQAFQEGKTQALVLSDAGEAGLNLQRGHTLVQYDRPMTAKTHAQRNGRIDRLGQQHPDISLVDLQSDTPFEARAQERIDKKYELRRILTDPDGLLDDTGMAELLKQARAETTTRAARQAKVS